jgi:SET domain-containing protein
MKRIKNSELKKLVYSARSGIHGTGLFAAVDIRKGTYIGTYHGPGAKKNGMYVLWVYDEENPDDIIGISGKNLLRYLNHSRPGNAFFEEADLYARRRIRRGEEITFDYGDEWKDHE